MRLSRYNFKSYVRTTFRIVLILAAIWILVLTSHTFYVRVSSLDSTFVLTPDESSYLFLKTEVPNQLEGMVDWTSWKATQSWFWPVFMLGGTVFLFWMQSKIRTRRFVPARMRRLYERLWLPRWRVIVYKYNQIGLRTPVRILVICAAIWVAVLAVHAWYVRMSPLEATFAVFTGESRKLFLIIEMPSQLEGVVNWVSLKAFQSWLWPILITAGSIFLFWLQSQIRTRRLIPWQLRRAFKKIW